MIKVLYIERGQCLMLRVLVRGVMLRIFNVYAYLFNNLKLFLGGREATVVVVVGDFSCILSTGDRRDGGGNYDNTRVDISGLQRNDIVSTYGLNDVGTGKGFP